MENQKTQNKKQNVERLVLTAVFIALAAVLSELKVPLPFGGGVTIMSMLPILILGYRYGMAWGVASAFIYSLVQMMLGFDTVGAYFMPGDGYQVWWKAIIIVMLDYIIAYTAMCLGGLFRNKKSPSAALCLGSVVALSVRYLVHILSGAIFFGTWAEWFFSDELAGSFGSAVLANFSGFSLSLIYSAVYNGLYMIPEIIITAIGAFFIAKIPVIAGKQQ